MNQHPKREPSLGRPDEKDDYEKAKTGRMSSYKEQKTKETKEFQQKEQKGQNIKAIQLNKTIPSTNKQRTSMWNQYTYGVGTWTKDKIEIESLPNGMSWSSIVSRTSKQNSYPCTINLSQHSSLSSLSHNIYRQRRRKSINVSS